MNERFHKSEFIPPEERNLHQLNGKILKEVIEYFEGKETDEELSIRGEPVEQIEQAAIFDGFLSLLREKGVRVSTVIDELGGEKIDIVQHSNDPIKFITAALSPATNLLIELDEKNKSAVVTVPEDQLSLAIGREGQNVRLAAKLTEFKIDIKGPGGMLTESEKKKMIKEGKEVKERGEEKEEQDKKMEQKEKLAAKGTDEKNEIVSSDATKTTTSADDKQEDKKNE